MFRYQLDIFCWLIFLKNFQDFLRKTTAKLTYLKYFKLVKIQEYLKKYQHNKFIFLYFIETIWLFFDQKRPNCDACIYCDSSFFFHTTLKVTHPIQPLSSEIAFSPNQSISLPLSLFNCNMILFPKSVFT